MPRIVVDAAVAFSALPPFPEVSSGPMSVSMEMGETRQHRQHTSAAAERILLLALLPHSCDCALFDLLPLEVIIALAPRLDVPLQQLVLLFESAEPLAHVAQLALQIMILLLL